MLDPYKMVFVNVIGIILILLTAFIYQFIYPKKKVNLFYILIAFSITASISILRKGAYESGDFNIHIYRSMEFFKSLMEGNLMPSWAGNLNAGYGYPLFIFNYSLPYYFISFFHLLGLSFIASLKTFLFLNMIFSSIFMYVFIQNKFKNNIASFVSAIFYLFAPYHLVSVHFKVTIGEILSFTLIPLCFLFLDKFIEKNKTYFIISVGLILGLISLSHIFIAISLIPIIFVYLYFHNKNLPQVIKNSLVVFFIGSIISFYQWLPPILYKNYLYISSHPINFKELYYPNLIDLLFSPWRYGLLFQGPQGEISHLIGYGQILIIISIVLLFILKKISSKFKTVILTWLIILGVLIFMMSPQSKLVWSYMPIINAAGPHRLLIIIAFIISLLAGYLALIVKNKKLIYVLLLITVFSTILNWGQRRVIPSINDYVLKNNLPYSTYQGENHFYANTKWVDEKNPWFSKIPSSRTYLLNDTGTIKSSTITSTTHEYIVDLKKDNMLIENTLYFPGWNAYADDNALKVFPDEKGVISIDLPRGKYTLILKYEDLLPLKIAKTISLAPFIGIIAYLIYVLFKTNSFSRVLNRFQPYFPKFDS
ncbi:MAG: glycosyltransferase family 39 protein [Candidatus Levybacteria bacterium]|nr:glycosyltransferase family 39 protein [Candidatus Levybacteria bacterium]